MLTRCKGLVYLAISILLAGCGGGNYLAPVTESIWHTGAKYPAIYKVKRGDTLYSIAFRYDTDYRSLAQFNHLYPPYALKVGQILKIQTTAHVRLRPSVAPVNKVSRPVIRASWFSFRSNSGWYWPVRGRVVTSFIPEQGKKGINIACYKGEKVHAASGGVVAYAGSGLAGYGNLIIIKHNYEYLTAYGNSAKNLVSVGQSVKPGQVIAEVGEVDHKYYGIHFEIRKAGKPVNPLNYLRKG